MVMTVDSPLGILTLREEDGRLVRVEFGNTLGKGETPGEAPVLKETAAQLKEYFEGRRKTFDVPCAPAGTAFQQTVWQALCKIPYGETRTYRDVAVAAGSPKGYRAVGLANNKNPIPILIPCHRVIGADGSLTGYAGGLSAKQILLELEGV